MREKTTAYVLLGALATGGPMTGYDIRAWIDRVVGRFWSESFGQIYPELRRLAGEGLITQAGGPGEGRDGRPYRITPAGRGALVAWLGRAPRPERARSEILLKLFLGRFLGADTARGFLEAARDAAAARQRALAEDARAARADARLSGEDRVFALLVAGRGLAAARADRAWAEHGLAVVEALAEGGPDAALALWDGEIAAGLGVA